ncbi:MAG: hypothetical protein AAFW81_07765 [Pseudomonadota bacterium]
MSGATFWTGPAIGGYETAMTIMGAPVGDGRRAASFPVSGAPPLWFLLKTSDPSS